MIKIRRNVKKGERRKLGIKRSSKVRREHGLWNFATKSDPLRKSLPTAKWFRSLLAPSAKIFAAAKRSLRTRVPFHSQVHSFRSCKMAANFPRLEIHRFAAEVPFWRVFHSYRTTLWHTSAISQPSTLISQLRNGCEISMPKNPSARTPWMEKYQTHPHFGNCWTHFDHLSKFISCIRHVISNLGKSGVQSFKRCSIWS